MTLVLLDKRQVLSLRLVLDGTIQPINHLVDIVFEFKMILHLHKMKYCDEFSITLVFLDKRQVMSLGLVLDGTMKHIIHLVDIVFKFKMILHLHKMKNYDEFSIYNPRALG